MVLRNCEAWINLYSMYFSPHPHIILRCSNVQRDVDNSGISAVLINERRLLWGAIVDLKVVEHACDASVILMIKTVVIVVHRVVFNVHALYDQLDLSARGQRNCVDAVRIVRVIVRIRWWREDATWGCEVTPAALPPIAIFNGDGILRVSALKLICHC